METQTGEDHIMLFLYYIMTTFILPAPTGRRLQPPSFTSTNWMEASTSWFIGTNLKEAPTPFLAPPHRPVIDYWIYTIPVFHCHSIPDHLHSHTASLQQSWCTQSHCFALSSLQHIREEFDQCNTSGNQIQSRLKTPTNTLFIGLKIRWWSTVTRLTIRI